VNLLRTLAPLHRMGAGEQGRDTPNPHSAIRTIVTKYGYQPDDFPVAYQEYQRIVSLPLYPRMSDRDVEDVIEAVCDVVGKHIKREKGRRRSEVGWTRLRWTCAGPGGII
jgi:dTDP-4-amino-4,6-dideoxygalactose transaminase